MPFPDLLDGVGGDNSAKKRAERDAFIDLSSWRRLAIRQSGCYRILQNKSS